MRVSVWDWKCVDGNRGYTIDQTILIVAIIAILITLVIVTVGWNLINKTQSTKMVAVLRQLEQANSEFFVSYGVWPQDSYTGSPSIISNALALTGSNVTYQPGVLVKGGGAVRNFVSGLPIKNGVLQHPFSGVKYSGNPLDSPGIYLNAVNNPKGMAGRYIIIMFDDVMLGEARRADLEIDGEVDFSKGRLVAGLSQTGCQLTGVSNIPANAPDNRMLDTCYIANLLN